ncbi:hypothetical protein RQP53_18940 [Paucibacter sp. APW11]|uniref:Solute-binding protein family 3/N-terminal domain-containing protein n=1 Tax=Roseateles aquae TaxID=3077235 RepID=A0ABU3PFU2_9BURK|nr:hypothetical protein [Paucibacter sp. APW11]MDT9001364.1 hypothetical protein [Paucibacter sp. APW11]
MTTATPPRVCPVPLAAAIGLALAGVVTVLPASAADERCPEDLRVAVLDYELAPLLLGKDKSAPPTGKLIDWIRGAIAKAGCAPRLQLQRLPINRGRELLFRGDIDIWGVAFPGAELIAGSALPLQGKQADPQLGFYLSSYSLYVEAGNTQIEWDGQTLRGPWDMRVGVAPVPALRAVVDERGWIAEHGLDTQNVLNKLLSGRSAVAILPDMLIGSQPPDVAARLRKLSPAVLTSWYYAPVSKSLLNRHPQFVRGFWLEMCRAGRAEQHNSTPCHE